MRSLRVCLVAAGLLLGACSDSNAVNGGGRDAGDDLSPDLPVNVMDLGPDLAPAPDVVVTPDITAVCRSNDDCLSNELGLRACDTITGRCVACTATSDLCPASQHCDPMTLRCAEGCRSDEGCPMGAGRRCDTTTHVCVDCTVDSHCAAGMVCASNRCATGCNPTQPCATGQTCCASACVDVTSSVADCGMCGRRCEVPNATATCAAGACAVGSCTAPFGDCDSTAANGCETDTATTVMHCGGCGMACAARANTTVGCTGGVCRYACAEGFADCDMDATNGCETDTRTSADHCGMCGAACRFPSAAGVCATGTCSLGACAGGMGNCDGDATNGCETDTRTTAAHCGGCGVACMPANATGSCAMGACQVAACAMGFANCDMMSANGCEADTRSNAAHCGGCGMACAPTNATGRCAMGACGVGACATGFGNCNGLATDGCEVSLATVGSAPTGIANRFAPAGSGNDQTSVEDISVAVGPRGEVYVLSYNDKIIVFDRDGRYLRNIARRTWSTAYDIAVDPVGGDMWLIDPGTNQALHLTPEGNPSDIWTAGSGSRGIAFAAGEVYVSDLGGNRVLVYSPTGALRRTVTSTPALSAPRGLAVGPSGNLYVSSYGDNTLRILRASGELILNVPTVANPTDVAVDECRGVAYVLGEASDAWTAHRIADGGRLFTVSTNGGTSHAGIAVSEDGSRVYVALNHGSGRETRMYFR